MKFIFKADKMKIDTIKEESIIFPWNPDYITGLDSIDSQHKNLLIVFNKLVLDLLNKSNEKNLNEIFYEFICYVDDTFRNEEILWTEYFDTDKWLQAHKIAHSNIIESLFGLMNKLNNEITIEKIDEIISLFIKWIDYHMLSSDMQMAKVVLSKHLGVSISDAKKGMLDEFSDSFFTPINESLQKLKLNRSMKYSNKYWELEHNTNNLIPNPNNLKSSSDTLELPASINLFTQMFQNSKHAILICDKDNNIISINPVFSDITGYSAESVIGKNPKILASGKHNSDFYHEMWESLNETGQWCGEIYNKRANGDIYPEMLSIYSVKGEGSNIEHYFAMFNIINSNKIVYKKSHYDMLTNLPNRYMFNDLLENEIEYAKNTQSSFALLFIDLDNFKDVNDTLGHEVGDVILMKSAYRIQKQVRKSDTVAHFGGDRYVVLLSNTKDTLEIEFIANTIITALKEPFAQRESQIYLTSSIGIALYPSDGEDVSHLLKRADQAMYMAKKYHNRYLYFTPSMQVNADKRRTLISDLHEAVKYKQFEIYYQPIVDMKTLKIKKAEALIRWNHPKFGLVSPDDFISLAEEIGLIVEIGDWVYYEATRQTKLWNDKYDSEFKISINKSPIQFRSESKIEQWIEHLEKIGLSTKNVVIEITESNFMENESNTIEKLIHLNNAGYGLSLDDFGTGYSSLSYLQKFNVDYIKIDRSFVSSITLDSKNITLCEAIIVMAHKLGIKVIAEGIETNYQYNFLADKKCDYGQGYLFSRPVSAQEFEKLLHLSNSNVSNSGISTWQFAELNLVQ